MAKRKTLLKKMLNGHHMSAAGAARRMPCRPGGKKRMLLFYPSFRNPKANKGAACPFMCRPQSPRRERKPQRWEDDYPRDAQSPGIAPSPTATHLSCGLPARLPLVLCPGPLLFLLPGPWFASFFFSSSSASSSSPRVCLVLFVRKASQSSSVEAFPFPLPQYYFLARMTNQRLVKCPEFGALIGAKDLLICT